MEDNKQSSTEKAIQTAKEWYSGSYINDLTKPIKERISNPLIFAFICSFVIINWDYLLYLLFSKDIIEVKISRFYLYYVDIKDQLVKPLLLAILYVLGFPYVTNFITTLNSAAKKEEYLIRKNALGPEYDYRLEEANNLKKLQTSIAEGTDIALLNKNLEELKNSNKIKDIQLAEQKSTLDKLVSELRESTTLISTKELEMERLKIDHDETVRNLKLELSTERDEIISKYNKIFNSVYDSSKFKPDLFQDSFSFTKKIARNKLEGFKNFMRDRMKYFGVFTSDIKDSLMQDGSIEFTVHFNYPHFRKNENMKNSLKKMFVEAILPE